MNCIDSLKKQSLPPKEIIVVLDPDEFLIEYYKKRLNYDVQIVISDTFGLSAARNVGIKTSSSEFIAFIDDDAVADCNWLKVMISNFTVSSIIGVGGCIVPVWPNEPPNWFPEALFWIIGCSYKGLPTKKSPIRNPIGCNMAFRRSIFEKVGYFKTNTGRIGNKLIGHDDTEFGIRATNILSGTEIVYDPDAVVYHHVSQNRVTINYILKRSYAEGLSKAMMIKYQNKATLRTEKSYLRSLFSRNPLNVISRKCKNWSLPLLDNVDIHDYGLYGLLYWIEI